MRTVRNIAKQKAVFAILALTTFMVLLFVPYESTKFVSRKYGRGLVRSLVLESRYSQSFHRVVGWGNIVQNLSHTFSFEEGRKLKQLLEAAAFNDKTVIVTTLNGAWAGEGNMLEVFLESFRVGEGTEYLLQHLIIVALDQLAFDRCKLIHMHCFVLQTDGVDFSGEKFFMSADYLKMMWRRIGFLQTILEMGYSFLFTDADILWFRDPFKELSPEIDFQVACDKYNGKPTDLQNKPNGGFLYVPSNNRTINFYRFWYAARLSYPGQHDQDVFNELKFTPEFAALGLTVKFLDTEIFSGFCRPSTDFTKVYTMHANCCKGLDKKLIDLRLIIDDWKNFKSLAPADPKARKLRWSNKECLRKPRKSFLL